MSALHRHAHTLPAADALGQVLHPYQPTHTWAGEHLDRQWRALAELPLNDEQLIQMKTRRWFGKVMRGWLRREDALKLYELAWHARGDILELGCYHGLSTSILARAVHATDRTRRIHTCDLRADRVKHTLRNVARFGLGRYVHAEALDAIELTRRFADAGRQVEFAFVDHSHAYEPVLQVCRLLDRVIAPGGFVYFHDFNDARNHRENPDYGVFQAVMDGLSPEAFEFWGTYGCAGLYRRRDDRLKT